MFRKSVLKVAPLALAAFTGAAFADDSSVTLYGVLDAAIANIQHAYNFDPIMVSDNNPLITKAPHSATGMFSGGLSATRWGIKGQEDIGGGVKAIFLLESGFNISSGAIGNAVYAVSRNTAAGGPNANGDSALNGQLFARAAYVGLSSTDYGSITGGRNTSFMVDNLGLFDPLLGSYAFSPIGYSGAFGGGGYTEDSRVDSSLKYKISFGDFTVGALYKFGGVAGSSSSQGAYQLNAVYQSGPLAIGLGYEQFKDAFTVVNPNGTTQPIGTVVATAADTKAYMLGVKYKIQDFTLRAGYEREQFTNPSNPTQDALTNTLYGTTVFSVNVAPFPNQKNFNVFWVGGGYDFTDKFTLMGAVYRVTQNAFGTGAVAGCSSTASATCSGNTNYYSLVGDYHLSKRTDTYLGIMKETASGGMAAGFVAPQEAANRTIALGFRHTF